MSKFEASQEQLEKELKDLDRDVKQEERKIEKLTSELPIRIREAVPADVDFIFSSWLKSYRNSHFSKNIINTIYFQAHHRLIENLLKTEKVLIACNKEDATQIYGYCCAGQEEGIFTLHYIYVKQSFRNFGVAKILLHAFNHDKYTAGVYTHHTRFAENKAQDYNMLYHPYLLFNRGDKDD